MHRRGFTLIELLVVILIIAILAGMILTGANIAREAVRKTDTAARIGVVRAAIEAVKVERGGSIAPVPHPFANTAADPATGLTRTRFVRSGEWGAAGTPVSDLGAIGYRFEDPSWVDPGTPAAGKVLLPSDVFVGIASGDPAAPDAPQFYGLPRSRLRILGAVTGLDQYMQLPDPSVAQWADQDRDGRLDDPIDDTKVYRRQQWLQGALVDLDSDVPEAESVRVMSYALAENVRQDLTGRGGLVEGGTELQLGFDRRVRLSGRLEPQWHPGHARDAAGAWQGYRIRGLGLVDAWGGELLAWRSAENKIMIVSAGPDGHFAWHPGGNGGFEVDAWSVPGRDAVPLDSDDRNAIKDNISDADLD